MAPAHGGNTFKLFAFDCESGEMVGEPVVLSPTPDTQGPSGLMAYRSVLYLSPLSQCFFFFFFFI